MEQIRFPVHKSKPTRPFLSTCLTTSTPESHQITKRIKGVQGYSEHYKGQRVDPPGIGPSFAPLRTRDYRKARELTLEIWDPMIQASFLERFLKSQKNLQDIMIKVLTKQKYEGKSLKRLCEILSKISGVTRVHIDFDETHMEQIKPDLLKEIKCMRKLAKLKDLNVTVGGEQVLPFSVSLAKVGFVEKNSFLRLEAAPTLQKAIEKALKFNQLDTIRIDTKKLHFMDEFMNDLIFVISKLPNLRELDCNYSKDHWDGLSSHFLDSLAAKATKIEILKLIIPGGQAQVPLLKHPIFKAKSLRRTSLSLSLVDRSSDSLNEVFDLLGEIPSLYELSLRFSTFVKRGNEITEGHMEKINRMIGIRKLNILFDFSSTMLSEKQAGNIFRSIFNEMPFLEELELHLPRQCLGLNARDIQGLRRLKKATLHFQKSLLEKADNPMLTNFLKETLPKGTKDMLTKGEVSDMEAIVEILGKCHQLRELELKMLDCVSDYPAMAMKVSESLGKLKRLQVFRITVVPGNVFSNMTMDSLDDLMMACHKLRDLQDLRIEMWGLNFLRPNFERVLNFFWQLETNPKYRFIS